MPDFSRKSGSPRSASGAAPQPASDPQLSPRIGVTTGVSSVAIDRGLLPGGRRHSEAGVHLAAPVNYEAMVDADVMLRVKEGDDAAFEYLVTKFRRPMLSFMYRMARNSAVAEELVQEIFLRVYRSRATYNAEAKFSTWLYRIATNLAVNHARDTKYEKPELSVSLDERDSDTGQTLDLADGTRLRRAGSAAAREAGRHPAARAKPARAPAPRSLDAQVPGTGLPANCRGFEVKRVGDQVAAVPRL